MISNTQRHQTKKDNPATLLLFGLTAVGLGSLISLLVNLINNPVLLGVGLAGIVVVLAIAIRLEWGLFVLVFITYTRFSDVLVHEHGLPSIAQPLSLLLLGIVAGRWLLQKQNYIDRRLELPLVLLGSYGLMGFASLLYAEDIGRAQFALESYLKDIIIAVLIIILLRRVSTFRAVVWTLLVAGIFMGTITAYQQLSGTHSNTYLGFGMAEVQNIIGQDSDFRIAGPVGDPNFYAQILLVLIPLALDRLWREKKPLLRFLAAWAFIVCLLSIMFTFSRGAFLALLVMAALLVWQYRIRFTSLLVTIVLLMVLYQFVPEQYGARLQTMTDLVPGVGQQDLRHEISFRGRLSESWVGWRMFADHPVLGVGWSNYPAHYQRYSRQLGFDSRLEARDAHNFYLEMAAESGLVGLIMFGLLLGFSFSGLVRTHKALTQSGYESDASLVKAYGIGLIGYLTAAFFLHSAYPRFLWLLLGIAMAVAQLAPAIWPQRLNGVVRYA